MAFDVIVGLGNEGVSYRHTRHNLGAYFVDACVASLMPQPMWHTDSKLRCTWIHTDHYGQRCYFVKTMGFMNESGQNLQLWLSFFKKNSQNVLLCCDDITIPLGILKVTFRPGTAGHHGVEDVLTHVGPGFVRFRLGIGPKKHPEMDLKDHVLGHFAESEQQRIEEALPSWISQLKLLLDKAENPRI
jgi:PTH1 family peptidyl-tRNA hydrolase